MDLDLLVALGGLVVGFTVGLTGMGGGALMTPMLILLFKVDPLAAVSSDIVASVVMKPIGGGVHLRRGTVHTRIVLWLMAGSVPAAFAGVLLLDLLGDGPELDDQLKVLLGGALFVAATAMTVRLLVQARRPTISLAPASVPVRVLPTVLVGVVGGLIVGLTSVGSGSLMIVLLLSLYPRLQTSSLVGTDLVQAVPLVASAALGHLLFGDFQLALTTSLLIGCVPGVYVGARLSSRAPDHAIRPVLVAVLVASALKLLGAPTALAALAGLGLGSVTATVGALARRQAALPAPERIEVAPAST
ncbi:MAG TPA: sulfite exporter TauE/SafE family protein [Acidimicrobiales bacterium]|nr:sulfite exporter TauE/SafE family protein [Acidimicrobiales bacterium]